MVARTPRGCVNLSKICGPPPKISCRAIGSSCSSVVSRVARHQSSPSSVVLVFLFSLPLLLVLALFRLCVCGSKVSLSSFVEDLVEKVAHNLLRLVPVPHTHTPTHTYTYRPP